MAGASARGRTLQLRLLELLDSVAVDYRIRLGHYEQHYATERLLRRGFDPNSRLRLRRRAKVARACYVCTANFQGLRHGLMHD